MNRSFVSVIAGGFGSDGAISGRGPRLRRAPRDPRRRGRRAAGRRDVGRHHARLRHGRRPGAVPRRRADQQAARQGRRGPLRHPPGRRPAARPHERAARRGPGALRHRARDGRDQRATSPTPTSCSSSAPTTPSTRPPSRSRARPSPACRCSRSGTPRTSSSSSARWPPGYAGVQNPLFFKDNSRMLFGDAKERVDDIVRALDRASPTPDRVVGERDRLATAWRPGSRSPASTRGDVRRVSRSAAPRRSRRRRRAGGRARR